MEFFGGLMIMAVFLGLLFAAVWISLPVMLLVLGRRIEENRKTVERLEKQIAALEQQLGRSDTNIYGTSEIQDKISGGVDGTA